MKNCLPVGSDFHLSPDKASVIIIGAGLAGTLAAIILGRVGHAVTLIDRHSIHPPDFRAEQLVGYQVEMLAGLGLLDIVVQDTIPAGQAVALRGERRLGEVNVPHYGISYETMVNRVRQHLPATVHFIIARVTDINNSADRQFVGLSDGRRLESRLVIVACGPGRQLIRRIGIGKTAIHQAQSLAFGFNLTCENQGFFDRSVLVMNGDEPAGKVDYLTLFRIDNTIRGNLFTYHDPADPWIQDFRQKPLETLRRAIPHLEDVPGKIQLAGPVELRVIDLTGSTGHRVDGVVMVGDAFQTSSPAAGTGVSRLLNDIDRLCNVHVPDWLATPGMDVSKISRFYDDPIKQKCDREALRVAGYRRAVTLETSLPWRAHRARVALQNQVRSIVAKLLIPRQAKTSRAIAAWASGGMAPPSLN